jgi:predicted phage baseplate assembly protein
MPLPVPKLDDRHFQDIVDEARKRIPHYSKEWTDHNLSDPGITLIELFAWMTDLLLYRLNQVPDLHYIRFMEMLGIRLREPVAAKTRVTFWLSKPQAQAILIPAGTEVASQQTEKEPSIIFTTDVDFRISPPVLQEVFSGATGEKQNLKRLEKGFDGFNVFSPTPKLGDALYFGFENDLSYYVLGFELDYDPGIGAGVNPDFPPYAWEVSTGRADDPWDLCEVEFDSTKGMNAEGKVQIHLPQMGKSKEGESEQFWVRVRVKEITRQESREGMRPFKISPKLRKAAVQSWGGSIPATHAQRVTHEIIGRSEGSPGERYQLQMPPILKRTPDETLTIHMEGEPPQTWIEKPDFCDSQAEDRHFTLDGVTGELRLGPAVRQPDGTIKLYGAIPPRGATLIFERYRHGGGEKGNVDVNVLNTLKTSIPFIDRVANRRPAWGGLDQESLEAAMLRVPAMMRSRDRAVTEADFEFLARQALPNKIGRVKCVHPRTMEAEKVVPALVYVLVIPYLPHPERRLEEADLRLHNEDMEILSAYLDERRLLTTRVNIRQPAYVWVSVRVTLGASPDASQSQVEEAILARLYRFLNPLIGGMDGNGWPFGRNLFLSDIYQCLQGIPGVQFTRSVEMFRTQPGSGPQGNPEEVIELLAHGVIASGIHQVIFIGRDNGR